MSRKDEEASYPLRSLHDFLTALDKEWDRFRTTAVVGIITTGILLVFVIYRILVLLVALRRQGMIPALDDIIFFLFVGVFAAYEISLLLRQHRFFKRWERRVGLLLHLEERLIGEAEEKTIQDKHRPI